MREIQIKISCTFSQIEIEKKIYSFCIKREKNSKRDFNVPFHLSKLLLVCFIEVCN